jgi:hypothetical protein
MCITRPWSNQLVHSSYYQYLRVTYGTCLPAFQAILLGEIKLLKEIRMNDESGVVGHQSQRTNPRQMYYTKVVGGKPGPATVALHHGDDMEEINAHKTPHTLLEQRLQEWCQHITKYESIR